MTIGDFLGVTNQFKLDQSTLTALLTAASKPKQSVSSEKAATLKRHFFLKGPIPLPWIIRASALTGKALHVGIALWFYSGLTRSKEIAINLTALQEWGIQRDTARRGLSALEKAGLVTVQRRPGRKPSVKIIG